MGALGQPPEAQEGISASSKEQHMRDERHDVTLKDGFSLLWLINMAVTYISATVLLRHLLGAPGLVEQWRHDLQVPQLYHVITSVTFGTALCLDLLAAMFWCNSSRLEFTLLPAWIKGAPFVSSLLMALGQNVLAARADGKVVNLQRYICWMHTTPTVLYLIKRVSVSITTRQMWTIILLHEVQLGLGAVAKLSGGLTEVVLGAAVHLALVPVLLFLHGGLKDLGIYYSKHIARFVYAFTLVTYASFGVVWDLDAFNLISPAHEEAGYLLAEFASKVLFSSVLMFSCFKTSDLQRITVMRSIEDASQHNLIEELQGLVRQKDQFMGSVSHELRTPLNGIIGLSEAALFNSGAANTPAAAAAAAVGGPAAAAAGGGSAGVPAAVSAGALSPVTRNQFQLIRSSGLRLLHLVNDILDATALQHNGLVLNKQRVFLKPLCDEVADITRATLKPGVVLYCHVPHELEVLGDQDRIVQVLNNLVCNAVKFTPCGSITISARQAMKQTPVPHSSSSGSSSSSSTGADHQPGLVVSVSVTDTGYGIPANKLKSVFLPFEQVHVQASRSQRGLGLGLSIVHKLVTAMGGSVSISSQEGRGSTFTFSLPAYTAEDELSAAAAGDGGGAGPCGQVTPAIRNGGCGSSSRVSFSLCRSAQQVAAADSGFFNLGVKESCAGAEASVAPAGAVEQQQVVGVTSVSSSGSRTIKEPVYAGIEIEEFEPAYRLDCLEGQGADKPGCSGSPPQAPLIEHVTAASDSAAVTAAGCNGSSGHQPVHVQESTQASFDTDSENLDDWPMARAFDSNSTTGYTAPAAVAGGASSSGLAIHGLAIKGAGMSISPAVVEITAERFFSEVNEGRLQLLVVDDDDTNHQVMSLLLESAGHALVHTHSGPETLQYLTRCQLLPDMILLDAAMPGMDGRQVCRHIRSMMSNASLHLPIIMVTAQVSAYAVDASAAAGADDHLGKPFSRNELLQCVHRNLHKHKGRTG